MINERRVRRIKNIIYTRLFIVFILPAVLAVVLLFRVKGLEDTLTQVFSQSPPVYSQQPTTQGAGRNDAQNEDKPSQPETADGRDEAEIPAADPQISASGADAPEGSDTTQSGGDASLQGTESEADLPGAEGEQVAQGETDAPESPVPVSDSGDDSGAEDDDSRPAVTPGTGATGGNAQTGGVANVNDSPQTGRGND